MSLSKKVVFPLHRALLFANVGRCNGWYADGSRLAATARFDPMGGLLMRLSNFFFFGLKFIVLGLTVFSVAGQLMRNCPAATAKTVPCTGN